MPASCETALQQRCQQIVTSPVLTPEQKHILSGTQISFGIPSGIPEISTIRAYTYTRITNGTVRAGHV
ncbi:hypothetical protein MJN51_41500, partial [Salmonella enterica subsp. enterica serovar Kentucky]|nr:hypothetical protein [Salmonella enterica subsp. enterica serovar Kentucky]